MALETASPAPASPDAAAGDVGIRPTVASTTAATPAPVATAPAVSQSVPATASQPHWASSLPTTTTARHEAATLAFDDLKEHIGERMLITTNFGDVRDVTIDSFSKNEVIVRAYVIGGYMTQHIQRSQIRSVRTPY